MAHAQRAKRPLDPAATTAANEAVGEKPQDPAGQGEWMDAYMAAGGEADEEDWGDETPDETNQGCPEEEEKPEETYEWYFSA